MRVFFAVVVVSVIALTIFCPTPAQALVIWDESIQGDFSNNATTPTDLGTLNAENNRVVGSIGTWWSTDDQDFATFTVPEGHVLSQVIFANYVDGVYYDYVPFSLFRGTSASDPRVEFILLSEGSVGRDFLQFDSKPGEQPAGTYLLRFGAIEQDTVVDERSQYALDFNVRAIPEPATLLLFGTGLVGAFCRRKKT